MSGAGIGLPAGGSAMLDNGGRASYFDAAIKTSASMQAEVSANGGVPQSSTGTDPLAPGSALPSNPLLGMILSPQSMTLAATHAPVFAAGSADLSLAASLMARGAPSGVAVGAQALWQQAWLGGIGLFADGPVWVRWGVGSAAELVGLLSRRGMDVKQIQSLIAQPPPAQSGGFSPDVSEPVALGLMQPDGQLGGLGAGGLVRIDPGKAVPDATLGLLAYQRRDGAVGQLAMLPPLPRPSVPGVTGFAIRLDHAQGLPVAEIGWSPHFDVLMTGPLGTMIAARLSEHAVAVLAVWSGPAADILVLQSLPIPIGLTMAAMFPGNLNQPFVAGFANGRSSLASDHDHLDLVLRPRCAEIVSDPLSAALGSHIRLRRSFDLRLDLGDDTLVLAGADVRTILVSIDDNGLESAWGRAHALADALDICSDPVALLRRGEGLRARNGTPLWLRCLGIDKPDAVGMIPLASDLPRYEIIHARDGGWLIGHRVDSRSDGWRTSYPEAAGDEAALWLDLWFALPGAGRAIEPDAMRRFNQARANAEATLQRLTGLAAARAAEAWSAVALDIGFALSGSLRGVPDTAIDDLTSPSPENADSAARYRSACARGANLLRLETAFDGPSWSRADCLAIATARDFFAFSKTLNCT